MTVKTSTGLRNHLMATGSFKSAMTGGSIRIFAGPAAADADAAETGTRVGVVTNNGTGTGLTFAAAAFELAPAAAASKGRPAPATLTVARRVPVAPVSALSGCGPE